MRRRLPFECREDVLSRVLTEFGYIIIHESPKEVEAYKEPFRFQFFVSYSKLSSSASIHPANARKRGRNYKE